MSGDDWDNLDVAQDTFHIQADMLVRTGENEERKEKEISKRK